MASKGKSYQMAVKKNCKVMTLAEKIKTMDTLCADMNAASLGHKYHMNEFTICITPQKLIGDFSGCSQTPI
jgi:hypothetical protein